MLSASDEVQLGDGAVFDDDLKVGDTVNKSIPMLGRTLGSGKVTMTVTGPDNFALTHDITVPVRPAQTPMSQTLSRVLQPGETFTLSKAALTQFLLQGQQRGPQERERHPQQGPAATRPQTRRGLVQRRVQRADAG